MPTANSPGRAAYAPEAHSRSSQNKKRLFLGEHVAADRNIHQDADADHHAQNAGTTVRYERQRNADDRRPAHDHRRIDQNLPVKDGCNPDGQQHAEPIPGRSGDMQRPQKEQKIQRHQDENANESVFFGPVGECKVVFRLRHKTFLYLSALSVAAARQSAGPDGNHGILDLPVAAIGIVLDLQEREHAGTLVIVHDKPGKRSAGDQNGDDDGNGFLFDAFKKHHDAGDQCNQQSGPEIGFHKNEEHRKQNRSKYRQQCFEIIILAVFALRKQFGDEDDHGNFHQLRRLHVKESKINPAFRTVIVRSEKEDDDEHGESDAINNIPETRIVSVIDGCAWNHEKYESERKPQDLHIMQRFGQNIGDARQIEYADGDDGQDEEKQDPVERGKEGFNRARCNQFHK